MVEMLEKRRTTLCGYCLILCWFGLSLLASKVNGDDVLHVKEGEVAVIACNSTWPNDTVQLDWISDKGFIICIQKIKENNKFPIEDQYTHLAKCSDGNLEVSSISKYYDGSSFIMYTEDMFGQVNQICSVKVFVHSADERIMRRSVDIAIMETLTGTFLPFATQENGFILEDTSIIDMTTELREYRTSSETTEDTTITDMTSPSLEKGEKSTASFAYTSPTEEQPEYSTGWFTTEVDDQDMDTTLLIDAAASEKTSDFHLGTTDAPMTSAIQLGTSTVKDSTYVSRTTLMDKIDITTPFETYCSPLENKSTTYFSEEIIFPPSNELEQNRNLQAWFSRSHQNKFDVCYLKVLVDRTFQNSSVNLTSVSYGHRLNNKKHYGKTFECVAHHQQVEATCIEVKHPDLVTDGFTVLSHEETLVDIQAYTYGQDECVVADISKYLDEIYPDSIRWSSNSTNTFSVLLEDLPYGPDFGIYCTKGVPSKDLARQRALNLCKSGTNDDEEQLQVATLNNWAVKFFCRHF